MAEIYCKRCMHYEELGRPVKAGELCPACKAPTQRRVGRVGPATHFLSVLRAIFSFRGFFFLVAFAMIGTIPLGALAAGSVLLLYLGGLRLAINAMQLGKDGKVAFPEVSPEELFDKSNLLPALVFVFVFVWAPPIFVGYASTGVVTYDPASLLAPSAPSASPTSPTSTNGLPTDGASGATTEQAQTDKAVSDALKSMGFDDPALEAQAKAMMQKELDEAKRDLVPSPGPKEEPHLDAPRIVSGVLGLFLFLWAPMAIVLFLRNPSTLTMFHLRAGLATLANDPLGYLVLSLFVLPSIAARFGADLLTAIGPFWMTPGILWVKGALVMFAWGLCGLYVRQRARAFDLPVDDADWAP